jgi:hypothetical protein
MRKRVFSLITVTLTAAFAATAEASVSPEGPGGVQLVRVNGFPPAVSRRAEMGLTVPQRATLESVVADGALRVAALHERWAATGDDADRGEIQRQIEAIKLQARIEHLSLLAQFARERGDEEAAREAEAALRAWTEPKALVDDPTARSFEKEVR